MSVTWTAHTLASADVYRLLFFAIVFLLMLLYAQTHCTHAKSSFSVFRSVFFLVVSKLCVRDSIVWTLFVVCIEIFERNFAFVSMKSDTKEKKIVDQTRNRQWRRCSKWWWLCNRHVSYRTDRFSIVHAFCSRSLFFCVDVQRGHRQPKWNHQAIN